MNKNVKIIIIKGLADGMELIDVFGYSYCKQADGIVNDCNRLISWNELSHNYILLDLLEVATDGYSIISL